MTRRSPAKRQPPPLDVIRLDFGASVGRAPGDTTYALVDLAEAQIADLAAGVVPRVVRAMARSCLDWRDADARKARRP